MRILYDDQIFSWQRFGGISRYFVELQSHLPDQYTVRNAALFSDNHYANHCAMPTIARHGITAFNFPTRSKITRAINRANSIRLIRSGDFDILHPTYYDPYFLRHLGKQKLVVTVHDMVHELFDIGQSEVVAQKLSVINAATRIIAISQNTKRDLIQLLGVDPDKIDIIYHGHSIDLDRAVTIEGLPDRYLLFVGERDGYKNFDNFARAFALLADKFADLHLVCTGKPFSESQARLLAELSVANRVRAMFVDDNQLPDLYRRAAAFVFPSKYEGFGIPILEAMACNCPVVASAASCFEEIAGDAALYFDPQSPQSIANQIEQLLTTNSVRANLISSGTERIKLFSWEQTARQTAEVYRHAMEGI